ncbi:MAG: hypothetical protein AAFN13_00470 [Bacteroidota bacterium]
MTMFDHSHVLWKETLWYNALRAACCGLVWSLLTLGMPGAIPPYLAPVAWVVGYLFFVPIAYLFAALFGVLGVIVTGLASLFFVTLGDPFVCLLQRFAPRAVPVERPALFSLRALILVTVPEKQKPLPEVELPTTP